MAESPPDDLKIPLASLINLAIEHWRISAWLTEIATIADAGTARHALRRMNDFLIRCEIQTRDLTGAAFDPGLAVRVVDTIEDPALKPGEVIVDETISPLVLWRGTVVRDAEIVTRTSPVK